MKTREASSAQPKKIEPGSELHLSVLMAPHSLNLVVGEDRAALLAWGRDVWLASRKQALEEAAVICERKSENIARVNTYRGRVNAASQHAVDMVGDCAAAIRREKEE